MRAMRRILAADTSTSINAVALLEDGRLLSEVVVEAGRRHSERLLETVEWVLGEAQLQMSDIDVLAVSIGPGSFTGVRVGVAAWKGLACALQRPLVGVPTLDAMSRLWQARDGYVCPLLDAKMNEVYGAIYLYERGVRTKLTGDCVCPVEDLLDNQRNDLLFFGPGAVRYRDRIVAQMPDARFAPECCGSIRASAVAAEAFDLLDVGASTNPDTVVPIYLRKSQAELNRERALTAKENND